MKPGLWMLGALLVFVIAACSDGPTGSSPTRDGHLRRRQVSPAWSSASTMDASSRIAAGDEHRLVGTIGDGDAELYARTSNGSITIQ